jgi:hypothetical protein
MANVYEGPTDVRQTSDEKLRMSRFRPRYRALSADEVAQHDALKDAYAAVEALVEALPSGRYRALALTTLEESCMWAVKELTAVRDA